jgi:hypothetical protein
MHTCESRPHTIYMQSEWRAGSPIYLLRTRGLVVMSLQAFLQGNKRRPHTLEVMGSNPIASTTVIHLFISEIVTSLNMKV